MNDEDKVIDKEMVEKLDDEGKELSEDLKGPILKSESKEEFESGAFSCNI